MALSIDGHAIQAAGAFSGSNTSNITLTTSLAQDLIVVVIACEDYATPHATVSSVTATGLTFTKRSSVYQDNVSGVYASTWNTLEVWSAPAAAAQSAKVITVTVSKTIDCGVVAAFGVNYDGTSLPVWSANASLPNATSSTGTSAPSVTGSSTDAASLLFGFAACAVDANQTAGSGFTLLDSANNPNGGVAMALGVEYKSNASAVSAQTVAFATSWQAWGIIADAIEAPGGGGGTTQALTGTVNVRQKGVAATKGRTVLSGRTSIENSARNSGQGRAGLSARTSLEIFGRISASAASTIALFGKMTAAMKGVALTSGRAGIAGKTTVKHTGNATRSGRTVIAIQTRIFPMMRGTLNAGIALFGATSVETTSRGQANGRASISGKAGIETTNRGQVSGRVGLLGRTEARVRMVNTFAGRVTLAARAALRTALRGVISSALPGTVALVASAFAVVTSRAAGAGRAGISGALQIRTATSAMPSGRLAIAARTALRVTSRMVPPGSLALFGSAKIALRGVANSTRRATLTGAATLTTAGRAVAQALGLIVELRRMDVTVKTGTIQTTIQTGAIDVEITG